jgi:hypothetical protein
MTTSDYLSLKSAVIERGYTAEIDWAAGVQECSDAMSFACETIWVILNAGMREQVARIIQDRIMPCLHAGGSASEQFRHKLKCRAIDHVWNNRIRLYLEWAEAGDQLAYLETLPHIGPITKFHLARNLGLDVCKPDRHLVRIASPETPATLCERIAADTGDRIGLVDCVIWRAANLGLA